MTTIINHKPTIFHKIKTALKDIYSRSIYNKMLHHSQDPLELNIFKNNNAKQYTEGVMIPIAVKSKESARADKNNRKDINDDLPLMLFI
jgi:hypothetical protein